jgi:3-oxoacyl-[acyl-carrier protein] reductase
MGETMSPDEAARPLTGRRVLVTGGNTGIGRAVCEAMADAGADVCVAWHAREGEARQLVDAISARGRRAHAVAMDVTDESVVEASMADAVAVLGGLDVLVNNAGIQHRVPLLQMSVAEFDRMLDVHVRGAFLCSRAFARHRIDSGGGGRIINVCSQLGYIGRAEYVAYSTAKGGMIAFTRALARELAPHGVLVNGVSPGLVDTGFDPLSEEARQAHAASLPLSRLGEPADITGAFVFLASDAARYFCGQMLHPNGGEIMP